MVAMIFLLRSPVTLSDSNINRGEPQNSINSCNNCIIPIVGVAFVA